MSATGTPSAPCRRINAFCASENFEAFIAFRSSQPGENTAENSSSKRPNFRGADHKYYNEDRLHGAIGNKTPVCLMTPAGASSPPARQKSENSSFRRSNDG